MKLKWSWRVTGWAWYKFVTAWVDGSDETWRVYGPLTIVTRKRHR